MMRRSMIAAAVTAGVLIGGCKERAREQPVAVANETTDDEGANEVADVSINADAVQSIMRRAVIEETEATPAPDPVPEPPTKATIAFASGSTLDAEGKAALDALLATPTLSDDMLFVLRGHSDPEGSDEDNLTVSGKRAEAVAAYLKEKGIAGDRITVIALGERRPIAPSAHPDGSDNPEGRARNRRVEVVVNAPEPTPSVTPPEAAVKAAPADERQPSR